MRGLGAVWATALGRRRSAWLRVCSPDLRCAQGFRLFASQGAFSHNSFQKNGNRIADCSFVNNNTTPTHNDMEAN
jgi:hypothetical protein